MWFAMGSHPTVWISRAYACRFLRLSTGSEQTIAARQPPRRSIIGDSLQARRGNVDADGLLFFACEVNPCEPNQFDARIGGHIGRRKVQPDNFIAGHRVRILDLHCCLERHAGSEGVRRQRKPAVGEARESGPNMEAATTARANHRTTKSLRIVAQKNKLCLRPYKWTRIRSLVLFNRRKVRATTSRKYNKQRESGGCPVRKLS